MGYKGQPSDELSVSGSHTQREQSMTQSKIDDDDNDSESGLDKTIIGNTKMP